MITINKIWKNILYRDSENILLFGKCTQVYLEICMIKRYRYINDI